jgi:hypothetical protein
VADRRLFAARLGAAPAIELSIELGSPLLGADLERLLAEGARAVDPLAGTLDLVRAEADSRRILLTLRALGNGVVRLDALSRALSMHGAPLGTATTLFVVERIAEILSLLHRARDPWGMPRCFGALAMDRVLIEETGAITLLGRGLPWIDALLAPSAAAVRFLAPEALREEAIDARADVYSLGVIAYELLTAHPYRDGLSEDEVRRAAIEHRAPDLPGRLPDPRPDLLALLSQMLAPHRDARLMMEGVLAEVTRARTRLVETSDAARLLRLIAEYVPAAIDRGPTVIVADAPLARDPLRVIGLDPSRAGAIISGSIDTTAEQMDLRTREAWDAILGDEDVIDEHASRPIALDEEQARPSMVALRAEVAKSDAAAVAPPAAIEDGSDRTMELPRKSDAPTEGSAKKRFLIALALLLAAIAYALIAWLILSD